MINMTFAVRVQVRMGNDKGESKWKTMEVGHPVRDLKNPSGKLQCLSLTSTLSDALGSACRSMMLSPLIRVEVHVVAVSGCAM